MTRENLRTTLRIVKLTLVTIQVAIVALLIKYALLDFSGTVTSPTEESPFEAWYGNWGAVVTTSAFFLVFLFFLTRPRKPKEWRGAGLSAAFFISLFAEMFGIPLTIFLLAPLLGVEPETFGMYESHLWAYLLARTGIMSLKTGVALVMVSSTGLIVLGFILLARGWRKVYHGENTLVTDGLYARLRHPQYLGLILLVVAFLIMWPTILTVLLAPFLIGRYILLTREEDRELEKEFGEDFRRYRDRVRPFIPSMWRQTLIS
jgi:protein-S-isoprenylcysteine O-methyltransferase Ste14